MRRRLGIDQVVDGDHLDVGAALVGGAQDAPSDPPESVDCNAYRHLMTSLTVVVLFNGTPGRQPRNRGQSAIEIGI
jgi:hypothetical protein